MGRHTLPERSKWVRRLGALPRLTGTWTNTGQIDDPNGQNPRPFGSARWSWPWLPPWLVPQGQGERTGGAKPIPADLPFETVGRSRARLVQKGSPGKERAPCGKLWPIKEAQSHKRFLRTIGLRSHHDGRSALFVVVEEHICVCIRTSTPSQSTRTINCSI